MKKVITTGLLALTAMMAGTASAQQVNSGDKIALRNGYRGPQYKYLDVAIVQPNRTPLKENGDCLKGGLFFCVTAEKTHRHTEWQITKVNGSGGINYGDRVYLKSTTANVGYLDMTPGPYRWDGGTKPFGGTGHVHNPVFASNTRDRNNGSSSQWIIKKGHDDAGSGPVNIGDTLWFESGSAPHRGYFLDTNMTADYYPFLRGNDEGDANKELLIFGTRHATDSNSQHWTIEKWGTSR